MLIVSFNLGGKYTFIIFFFKLFTEVSHIQTAKQDQEFQTHLYWEAYQLLMASSGSSLVLTNDPFQRHQNHLLPCLSWAPSPLVLAPRRFLAHEAASHFACHYLGLTGCTLIPQEKTHNEEWPRHAHSWSPHPSPNIQTFLLLSSCSSPGLDRTCFLLLP